MPGTKRTSSTMQNVAGKDTEKPGQAEAVVVKKESAARRSSPSFSVKRECDDTQFSPKKSLPPPAVVPPSLLTNEPRRSLTAAEIAVSVKVVTKFVEKLWQIVNEDARREVCSWTEDGLTFVIADTQAFTTECLEKHYKRKIQFSSFVRQLHYYGFKKVEKRVADVWHFQHDFFKRGEPDILHYIKRKTNEDFKASAGIDGSASPTPHGSPLVTGATGSFKALTGSETVSKYIDRLEKENYSLKSQLGQIDKRMKQQADENEVLQTKLAKAEEEATSAMAAATAAQQRLHEARCMSRTPPPTVPRGRGRPRASTLPPRPSTPLASMVGVIANSTNMFLTMLQGTMATQPSKKKRRKVEARANPPLKAEDQDLFLSVNPISMSQSFDDDLSALYESEDEVCGRENGGGIGVSSGEGLGGPMGLSFQDRPDDIFGPLGFSNIDELNGSPSRQHSLGSIRSNSSDDSGIRFGEEFLNDIPPSMSSPDRTPSVPAAEAVATAATAATAKVANAAMGVLFTNLLTSASRLQA